MNAKDRDIKAHLDYFCITLDDALHMVYAVFYYAFSRQCEAWSHGQISTRTMTLSLLPSWSQSELAVIRWCCLRAKLQTVFNDLS